MVKRNERKLENINIEEKTIDITSSMKKARREERNHRKKRRRENSPQRESAAEMRNGSVAFEAASKWPETEERRRSEQWRLK